MSKCCGIEFIEQEKPTGTPTDDNEPETELSEPKLYMLVVFAGIVTIVIGTASIITAKELFQMLEMENENVKIIVITMIIMGVLATQIGAVGFIARTREDTCGLHMFAIIILVIGIGHAGMGIFIVNRKLVWKEQLDKAITNKWQKMDVNTTDIIQQRFKCCGFAGPKDYIGNLSISCCPKSVANSCSVLSCFKVGCRLSVVKKGTFYKKVLVIWLAMSCVIYIIMGFFIATTDAISIKRNILLQDLEVDL